LAIVPARRSRVRRFYRDLVFFARQRRDAASTRASAAAALRVSGAEPSATVDGLYMGWELVDDQY